MLDVTAIPGHELWYPLLQRCGGFELKVGPDRIDVGVGGFDIAGLHRSKFDYRLLLRRVFYQLDQLEKRLGPIVADVVDAVLRRASCTIRQSIGGGNDTGDNVVDVSEIPLHLTVVEDRDRFAP